MLTHAGFQFAGLHGAIQEGPWQRRQQFTEVFGLDGATVLDGGRQPRDLSTEIWIFNSFGSPPALETYLKSIHARGGKFGVLNETGTVVRSWSSVYFDRLQVRQGPFYSSRLGWFCIAELHFKELAP